MINKITQTEAVKQMIDSLIEEAAKQGKSLEGISTVNWAEFLDKLFDDGGEVRCEKFSDLAWEYALLCGEFDSLVFNNTR